MFHPPKSSQRLLSAFALYVLCEVAALSPAWAAFVTTNETGLDAIFSQSAFSTTPIDVRFNPTVTINDPGLLTINTEEQLNRLFALGDNSPTVDVFFVDSINECGGVEAQPIIGCGQQPGNKLTVESVPAAGSRGAALIGHELGHNLDLDHVTSPPNLMNPTLTGVTTLTVDQVATILDSSLVQTDGAGRFILVTPFAIVPEPSSMLFALAGVVVVLRFARRTAAA